MEQKEYRKRLNILKNSIYKIDNKTSIFWDNIEKNILYLINNAPQSNEDAYILYAKYYYERQYYRKSTDCFWYILDNCPNRKEQCFYGLLKNYIMQKDYDNAFNCLSSLKEEMTRQGREKEVDFGLIEALLGYLNEYDVDVEIDPTMYLYSKFEDEYVLKKYLELLDYVVDQDFSSAQTIAKELNVYRKDKKLEIDFFLLCVLINACVKKKKENISLELK